MECNKDEAGRAKTIAEAKLEGKDFAGAKKFALKAQNLYPGLNGISQMLITLDVYTSSEKLINGQIDWYGVLGVSPTADDETIKKQYRKLALMLHPDKNNSAGADGAFKLISEAWGLLSDKDKRSAYNLITGLKGPQPKVPTNPSRPSQPTMYPCGSFPHPAGPLNNTGSPFIQPGGPPNHASSQCTQTAGPPGPSTESPFTKFAKRKSPAPKPQKKSAKTAPAPPKPSLAPANQKVESFWTICGNCKIQYEYHNLYRNTTLLCPNCKTPFVATEIPRPVTKSKLPKPSSRVPAQQQQQTPVDTNNNNSHAPPSANNDRGKNVVQEAKKQGPGQGGLNISTHAKKRVAGKGGLNISSHAKKPGAGHTGPNISMDAAGPSVVEKVIIPENKLKRPKATESNAVMDRFRKKRKLDGHDGGGQRNNNNNSMCKMREGQNGTSGTTGSKLEDSAPQELTYLEERKLLMGKARREVLRKVGELSPEIPVDYNFNTTTINNNKRKEKKAEKREVGSADEKQKDRKKPERINGNSHKKVNDDPSTEINNAVVMNVPDPDFYDFDQDRAENSFTDNDVWAAYDDDDGMPRFYVLIHKVISKRPFQLKISWLNSKTTTEFSPTLEWVGSGFYKTCGDFRIGKHETCRFVNAFSQRVKWAKGPRGAILIFPQKGDVWALYRNWSSDWDSQTPDDVIHKYDMVVVLDGYDEEKGLVSVAPLVKVVGYRTVFRPDNRKEVVLEIRREEMFRLSHRVPHHALTPHEAPGVPDGCVELDPAATPLELLGIAVGADGGNGGTGTE